MINDYLNDLNEAQKKAVLETEGPLLILAGAGTGKTKVLTSRLAHIIYTKKSFQKKSLLYQKLRVQQLLKILKI